MRLTSPSDRHASTSTRGRGLSLVTTVLTVLAATLSAFLVAVPAGATVDTDDYPARLRNAGQGDLVDPWNFWNRECTSFVAWRLNNDLDVPFHNYYLGVHWGNASNWGAAARKVGVPVNDQPRVSSVAWWAAGTPGSSRGHVSWVLEVTKDSITIEEYNWAVAGRYGRRVIDRDSARWPSGFIHYGPAKLQATTKPAVTGTPRVGTPLVADPGVWSPSGATFEYQWFTGSTPIAGATSATFTPAADLLGATLRVRVRASADGVEATRAFSAPSAPVATGVLTTTSAPRIVERPRVGRTLTADPGSWSSPAQHTYQWLAAGVEIPGATGPTYTPGVEQLGQKLRVEVTATAPGHDSATVRSGATWPVIEGLIATTTPTVSGDVEVLGELTVDPGPWKPASAYTFQWYADGKPLNRGDRATYVPTRAQLGKRLTVTVTGTAEGYETGVATSALTVPVAPGQLVPAEPPVVEGTTQVGEVVTADPGVWSPEPDLELQWLVDGSPLPGADTAQLALTPALAGRKVALQVRATRLGFRQAAVVTQAKTVALGEFEAVQLPTASTRPRLGRAVTVTGGTWSHPGVTVSYQWYADGMAVPGATRATFVPTRSQLGMQLTVRVTARATGYRPEVAEVRSGRVLRGDLSLTAEPVLRGTSTYGRLLAVRHGDPSVATADVLYRWYRGDTMIRGAERRTYRLTAADVGHRVWAKVFLRATNWAPAAYATERSELVATVPVLDITTRVVKRSVRVHVDVTTPGIATPDGVVLLGRAGRQVDRDALESSQASLRTGRLSPGVHRLRVLYRDAERGLVASKVIRVRVP